MAPVDGRIATSALAGPTSASSRSASSCSDWSRVIRSGSPGDRVDLEELALLLVGADGVHDRPVGGLQLVVVARLEAGQPGLVTDLVGVGVVLDHLGGHVADGAEDRCGELAGRRERHVVGDRPGARDGRR